MVEEEHSDEWYPSCVNGLRVLACNTGDKDAKVTFLTMVDNSSGSMVATAVQKKGHDKFVERLLLKSLESFGVTGGMVLQTDQETGPTDVAKHVAAEKKRRRPSSDRLPRKTANQTRTLNEHIKVSKPWSEP